MQENNGQTVPFTLYAEKARLTLTGSGELLSAGMAGVVPVRFEFSEDWDGLEKTAVFTNGIRTVNVEESMWADGVCLLPAEVLVTAGKTVMAGVYGTNGLHLVLPTVWCVLGRVEPAAALSGESLPSGSGLSALVARIEALEAGAQEDHLLITGMVPRGQQAEKTGAMTQAVGVDSNGKLWIPPAAAGVGTIAATEISGVYTYYGSDFDFTTIDDVMRIASGGTQMRLAILGANSTYLLTHMQGVQSTARLHFTGVTWSVGMNNPTLDVFEIDDQLGITRVSSTELKAPTEPLTVTLTESGGTVTSDTPLTDVCAAVGAGREIRVCADGRQGLVGEVNSAFAVFYVLDATGGAPALSEYELTSSGVTISVRALGDAMKPSVQTMSGNTPVIASAADNTVYDCTGTQITAVTVSSYSYGAAFTLLFNAQAGASAPTLTLDSRITMPDGFTVESNRHYEINVDFKGYATVQAWTLVD